MTNPDTKTQYEGAILQQLIKNAEELAVIKPKVDKIDSIELKLDSMGLKLNLVESKVDKIYSTLGLIKWLVITISLSILANIFSQPVLSYLFNK